jgi:hypothetical protein
MNPGACLFFHITYHSLAATPNSPLSLRRFVATTRLGMINRTCRTRSCIWVWDAAPAQVAVTELEYWKAVRNQATSDETADLHCQPSHSSASSRQWPFLHPSHKFFSCGPLLLLEYIGLFGFFPRHFLRRYATLSAYDPTSKRGLPRLLHARQRWLYTLALYRAPLYMRIVMAIFLLDHPLEPHARLPHMNRPMMLVS